MAATANEKTSDMKQGRLPFKVLDIKTTFQCPNTPQLKRKHSGSEDERFAKSIKIEKSSSETEDVENIASVNPKSSRAALLGKSSPESEKQASEDDDIEVVKDVLRNSIIDAIELHENEADDEMNSTLNSSNRSTDSNSNDATNDEKSEIVSESGARRKRRTQLENDTVGKTKVKRNKKEKEKRNADRERQRREKEKRLSDAKEEKRRLSDAQKTKQLQEKAELKRKKLQEREEVKQKVLIKKEMERKQKEEQVLQKLKAKEKEKEEKLKILEEKKQLVSLRQEEKRKREEEKQKKIEEKKRCEEEEARKKNKVKAAFESFFIRNEPTIQTTPEQTHRLFKPFELKKDMMLASVIPDSIRLCFDPKILEIFLQSQDCKDLYISELNTKNHKPHKTSRKTAKQNDSCEDVVILEDKENICERAKLFYFYENVRPPYWGTWRQTSRVVTPRKPFNKDNMFDYEVDSDEEWDEGGPGESLSGTEDEKESEDDYEVDNEFFVPHGYLSADEEKDEDDDSPESPEMQKMILKVREREFEEERKRKCQQLKPCILGCLWSKESNEELYKALVPYKAIILSTVPIIAIQKNDAGDKIFTTHDTPRSESKRKKAKTFPEEAMSYLIKLVHGNTNGKQILVAEFKQFWATRCKSDLPSGDLDMNRENSPAVTPPSPDTQISKGLVELTLKQIASYTKSPVQSTKRCWWVHEEIRVKYNLAELPSANSWEYVSRVEPQVLPHMPKTPTHSIMKFARKITPTRVESSPNSTARSVELQSPPSVPKTPIQPITKFSKRITPSRLECSPNSQSVEITNATTPKTKTVSGTAESKTGKKQTMSILQFAKRLNTEKKDEASISSNASTGLAEALPITMEIKDIENIIE